MTEGEDSGDALDRIKKWRGAAALSQEDVVGREILRHPVERQGCRRQRQMRAITPARSPNEHRRRGDAGAAQESVAIGEKHRDAGEEHENLGGVREAEIARRQPAQHISGDMVYENDREGDSSPEVD